MAKLNELVLGIQRRVRGDRTLSALLVSIATGQASTSDVRNFETAVRKLFYLAEFAGYTWQSTNANHRMTNAGITQLISAAKTKGTTVADSLTDYLGNNPMLVNLVKESILGQSVVLEGVGIGQLQTADEAGLGYKTWIYTGVSAEPRPHHQAMNGTTIPKNEMFTLSNGVSCSAPHDWSSAGAAEWNFCGCQVIYTNRR